MLQDLNNWLGVRTWVENREEKFFRLSLVPRNFKKHTYEFDTAYYDVYTLKDYLKSAMSKLNTSYEVILEDDLSESGIHFFKVK